MMSNLTGTNHTAIQTGSFSNIKNTIFTHEALGSVPGKNFLKEDLNLTGMEVSLNVIPANSGVPFHHKHQDNEELYIFIKGNGQFQVDGNIFDVEEGSMVRVAPKGVRIWRNNSNEDLYCIVIQVRENTMASGTISDGSLVEKEVKWPEDERETA